MGGLNGEYEEGAEAFHDKLPENKKKDEKKENPERNTKD